MPSVLLTAPSVEPVSLAEAKAHLRVDVTDDDALITALITAARQSAEHKTRRSLCTQQWSLVLDQFPVPGYNMGSANWYGPQYGTSPGPLTTLRTEGTTGYEIYLDHCPVQAVDSITYVDASGVGQSLPGSAYKLDAVTEPSRIVPAYGTTWPATRNEIAAVVVAYTTGYGLAAAVPQPIKQWILLRLGAMYENREETAIGRGLMAIDMPFADGLLDAYRVLGY
jgi:hypothetical protein